MDPNTILLIFSFIFGAVVGSFLNVCIYRLPNDISLVFPSSHCTSCKKPIPFYHNIPIISYLVLGGRCYNCREKYSWDYPLVEFLAGLLSLLLFIKYGPTINFVFLFIFVMALIVITFIDLEHMIIPNVISYPGVVVGLIYSALITDYDSLRFLLDNIHYNFLYILYVLDEVRILSSVFGAIIGAGSLLLIGFAYKNVRKMDGLGLGDVKLMAMVGAFLGWRSIIFVALISSLIGTIIGIGIMLRNKGDLKYAIPFGPFISFAATLYCFCGDLSLDYFID
ncbi:MAG: prepilin peptidase [Candidatus Dadabacteria bacterium]|nr:prepilin peptidase [Candidatus Dadabacteria bacterium]NIV41769.1 prepilin peptidase [Candidatus Dadabacteria bacterium]NIX14638.1 prepilin peptidase [Candidatus Dadabacteria bacterium]